MSVEKMSFITLTGPIESFDEITAKAFSRFEFQPEDAVGILKDIRGLYPFTVPNPYETVLKQCSDTLDRAHINKSQVSGTPQPPDLPAAEEFCNTVRADIEKELAHKAELEKQRSECEQIILQLKPIANLDVSIDALAHFEYVKFRFGKLPKDGYEKFKLYLAESQYAIFAPAHEEGNFVWGLYFVPRAEKESVDSLFASLHFERMRISEKVHGLPAQAIEELTGQVESASRQLAALDERLKAYIESKRALLLEYYRDVRHQHDIFEIRNYSAHSQRNFYVTGWMPAGKVAAFEAQLENEPLVSCIADEPDTVESYTTPPTKLHNWFLFRPFEQFVEMYGLPSYGEFDPTPLLAITYIVLFGIMFGDLGQGACLAIGGFLAYRLKGVNLGKILIPVGISSMVFGALYGSVFGNEDLISGFSPMEHINVLLVASIFLGVMLITFVMALNICNGIRQKDAEKTLFHQNGLAGLIFYWGMLVAVLGTMGIVPNPVSTVYIIVVLVLPFLIIYLKEPLGKLVKHDPDWKPHNLGEFLMENFFEMFEVLLSYISNSVSFIRVGAFALNHAGMMLAVKVIAGLVGGSGSMLVLVLGNLFVMCLEGLIVGIQVLRLEFYELFSRFFTGEGKPFEPFTVKYDK